MARSTTIELPEDLVARTRAYAAARGTTVTALIRSHLESVVAADPDPAANPLRAYSEGRLARADAIRLLGLRDYADLLVALGDADLALPQRPRETIEAEAALFERLWRET